MSTYPCISLQYLLTNLINDHLFKKIPKRLSLFFHFLFLISPSPRSPIPKFQMITQKGKVYFPFSIIIPPFPVLSPPPPPPTFFFPPLPLIPLPPPCYQSILQNLHLPPHHSFSFPFLFTPLPFMSQIKIRENSKCDAHINQKQSCTSYQKDCIIILYKPTYARPPVQEIIL